jgi:hypothetical protein
MQIESVECPYCKRVFHPSAVHDIFSCQLDILLNQPDSTRPDFTAEQVDYICYQIGEWYLKWKNTFQTPNRLGYAKEELKIMICGGLDD